MYNILVKTISLATSQDMKFFASFLWPGIVSMSNTGADLNSLDRQSESSSVQMLCCKYLTMIYYVKYHEMISI